MRGEAALLPGGEPVGFAQIDHVMRRAASAAEGRALTATLVVIGSGERLTEAAESLEPWTSAGTVRAILISAGEQAAPGVRVRGQAVAIEGLLPRFVDNVVAALRLSSLPTFVWWRGGAGATRSRVAALADRLILDEVDPQEGWAEAPALSRATALSDLRWTRLTRWRALMAHFFDMPDVRQAAGEFERLEVDGEDPHAARLLAGWLSSTLGWNGRVTIQLRTVRGLSIERVWLGSAGRELELSVLPGRSCVQTVARAGGREIAARAVSIGDTALRQLLAEELRVRTRDVAFERALGAAGGLV